MPERICMLIDGSNFYHYLRELGLTNLSTFDYRTFAQFLARGRTIVSATYYIGKVRTQGDTKSEMLRRWQQVLFSRLSHAGWHIEGTYLVEQNGRFQEKGIDVQMAVDLVSGAYEDKYDVALVVSSDTDLLPAIRKIRSKNKTVEYVGFAHRPTSALIKNANQYILLNGKNLKGWLR